MRLPDDHSAIVVGATQSGKTTSLVIPAILRWRGPLVVASAKGDVLAATRAWRSALGEVHELAPGSETGLTWNPLERVRNFHDALGVARDLSSNGHGRPTADSEFWGSLAVKLLAALAVAVIERGGDIFDLVELVDRRDFLEMPMRPIDPDAARVLFGLTQHESRTVDSMATTVDSLLSPWQRRQPLASLANFADGANTIYLVAPRHDQRRYEGVLRGALHSVIADLHDRYERGTPAEVLVVLDEAAVVAPIDDLDQLAATGRGIGITLLTVVQDFAQLEARWSERAATIVNNHATRVVLGGLSDPRAPTYVPELVALCEQSPLRQWPARTAVVVSGRRRAMPVRLRAWHRSATLRRRVLEESAVTL